MLPLKGKILANYNITSQKCQLSPPSNPRPLWVRRWRRLTFQTTTLKKPGLFRLPILKHQNLRKNSLLRGKNTPCFIRFNKWIQGLWRGLQRYEGLRNPLQNFQTLRPKTARFYLKSVLGTILWDLAITLASRLFQFIFPGCTKYNGKHCKQLHYTAMGSPVSVVVAEIVDQSHHPKMGNQKWMKN